MAKSVHKFYCISNASRLRGWEPAQGQFSYSVFRIRSSLQVEQYSTKKIRPLQSDIMVDYLINSLGFSKAEAISTASKVPRKARLKPTGNCDSVLAFFEETGFDKTQVKRIVSRDPELLYFDVENVLKPKIKILQNIGLTETELFKFAVRNQSYLRRGLDTHIRPTVDILREVLGSKENMTKAINKSPWVLSFSATNMLAPNILFLRECEFSEDKIQKFILRNPNYILQNHDWYEGIVHRLENVFGIPRKSPMFYHGFNALASQKVSTLEMKFEVFKSFGWTIEDIHTMFRKQPYCLSTSKIKLESVLNFLMKESGYTIDYVISHPAFMSYSLEKRVMPRNEVLTKLYENKLTERKLSLYYASILSESQFLQKFVLPYKDKMPDLYELYITSVTARKI